LRKKGFQEVVDEIKQMKIHAGVSGEVTEKELKELPYKKEIDELLDVIPLPKVHFARKLFEKWCNEYNQLEQIYRAFYSSYKTTHSYWHFKAASLILLYLYGYISDEELTKAKKDGDKVDEIFEKHKSELEVVKEIYDALKDKTFWGHIPMNVSCLAIGACISFTKAVELILNVLEELHSNEDYRKGHYVGGIIDWDEAILLRALPYHWFKKGSIKGKYINKNKGV
jgi:hypothetical protein